MNYRIDVQGSKAIIFDDFGRVVHSTSMKPGETYAEWLKRTQVVSGALKAQNVRSNEKDKAQAIASKFDPKPKKAGGRFAFEDKKSNKPRPWKDMGGGVFRFHGVSMQ